MPGLIINGKPESVSGLAIVNYKDASRLKLKPGEDMRARRTRWVRSIILHNTKNIQTVVKPGHGPSTDLGDRIARLWSTDARNAGAHLSVDWDGVICCHCDLLQDAAYHAGSLNEVSIGIEIYEDGKGVVYEGQLGAVVNLVVWLCRRFSIQMQMPVATDNSGILRIQRGGTDCVGVFGHVHQWEAGKKHDPGFDVFKFLVAAGFKEFNFKTLEDRMYWKSIQLELGLQSDGIPGPATCDALQARGYGNGLYDWLVPVRLLP